MMHVKYDRNKALSQGVTGIYERWAKEYKVDLSQPFLVISEHVGYNGEMSYRCVPPPSLKDRSQGVWLGSHAFIPCDWDKNLEDYL